MPKKSLVLTDEEIADVLIKLSPDATHGNGLRAVTRATALKIADGLEAYLSDREFWKDERRVLCQIAQELRQEAGVEK